MSDLRDAIDVYDSGRDVDPYSLQVLVEAARLVANPNIVEVMAKAMFDAQPSGIDWNQASEEARNFWRIFARAAVAAALTPGEDTDG